jgi:Tol biopolymer transport system component/imidazolonepropionase-like amidohydrolase
MDKRQLIHLKCSALRTGFANFHQIMNAMRIICLTLLWSLGLMSSKAQSVNSTKGDSTVFTSFKGLPLKASRAFPLKTSEGTWTSVNVSPDGKTLVFDLMGDIYTLPIEGGKATAVTKGFAYDNHPSFSPDGKRILFISDRSGAENLWHIDTEKKDTIALTEDNNQNFPGAIYTPDGNYIVYSKGRRNNKLYLMHKNGGAGTQLISAPSNLKTIDPAVSADGRYIYYSARMSAWNYNAMLPQYSIGVYDREKGNTRTIASRYGSAFTPVLSKDGKWLVYGSRFEDKTGLVKRNLATGEENWLAYPVQRDDQESIAVLGVLPAMTFTPDSKFLLTSYGGKIHKINIETAAQEEIPYTVDATIEMGPEVLFKYPVSDTIAAKATQIRDAVPSPDGKKLAFTVLNKLYVMDYPNGTPKRLTKNNFTEAQPAWHPNGKNIYFSTWNTKGGAIHVVDIVTGKETVVTKESALYQGLAIEPTGKKLVFNRTKAQKFLDSKEPTYNDEEDELCWMDLANAEIHVIDKANGRGNAHFVKNDNRIYLNSYGKLLSIQWDGGDEKEIVKITGITTFGSIAKHNGKPTGDPCMLPFILAEDGDEAAKENNPPSSAASILLSPTGNGAVAQVNNNIYFVTIPKAGKVVEISVADAKNAAFPSKLLTEVGGEFPSWEANGKVIHWSLGAAHFTYDIDKSYAFDDSVAMAKKAEDLAKELAKNDTTKKDSTNKDNLAKKTDKKETPKFKASEQWVNVYYDKDIPSGSVLLKNAKIITMNGDEVIEGGDVYIVNNRIKGIGKSGTLKTDANTSVVDISGKTIIPGFVDTHAHMWPSWGIHKNQAWIYAANLAYGVTTTRDPQTATTDVLTYSDMVEAGSMVGPRIYSTGPGVGYWSYNLKDSAQAESVLSQYSKYFNTKYIKMYLVGNRKQRQWVIQAAKNQQLMPTTEGGLDFKLNMTNLLDGYPGHEHSIPIYPLYNDVISAIAKSKMTVTPTLLVAYGGPWAENYFYETANPYSDEKMQFFTPYEELAAKSRRRATWFLPEEHVFQKHALSMKNLVEAGGLAGIGSHGQLQGLGYHWEVWSMQSGGMRNHDALKVATILGAAGLGLDKDLGSIETGKLADLIILNKDPLTDIHNTNSIQLVMKNGRLYNGDNLNETVTGKKVLDRSEWLDSKPVKNTNVKD